MWQKDSGGPHSICFLLQSMTEGPGWAVRQEGPPLPALWGALCVILTPALCGPRFPGREPGFSSWPRGMVKELQRWVCTHTLWPLAG